MTNDHPDTTLYLLLGAPGAGKGTVAARLGSAIGAEHVSTGDLLRRTARDSESETGRQVAAIMEKGELVPDEMMTRILARELHRMAGGCVVLDGFPRTLRQAELLNAEREAIGGCLRAAVLLEVPDAVLIERLAGRLVCGQCGAIYHQRTLPPRTTGKCDDCNGPLQRRDDDNPETVRNRLSVYQRKTAPLIDWYDRRGLLLPVNGEGSVETVVARVHERLAAAACPGGGSETPA